MQIRRTTGAPADSVDVYDDAIANKVLATITIADGNYADAETTITNDELIEGEYIVTKITEINGGSPADLVVNATVEG